MIINFLFTYDVFQNRNYYLFDNRERTMNAGTALRRLMKEYQGLYFKVYRHNILY